MERPVARIRFGAMAVVAKVAHRLGGAVTVVADQFHACGGGVRVACATSKDVAACQRDLVVERLVLVGGYRLPGIAGAPHAGKAVDYGLGVDT